MILDNSGLYNEEPEAKRAAAREAAFLLTSRGVSNSIRLAPMSKRDLGDDDDRPQSGRKLRLIDAV